MSTQTTVMGYIGERSAKLSSVYADNYVVPDVISATNPTTAAPTITMNTTSGRFTTGNITSPALEASMAITVTNSTVGVGSKILLTMHSTVPAADNGSTFLYVENIIQGAFDIRIANTSGAGWATDPQTFTISFLVFNPSA